MKIVKIKFHKAGINSDSFYTGIISENGGRNKKFFTYFAEYDKEGFVTKSPLTKRSIAVFDCDELQKDISTAIEEQHMSTWYYDLVTDYVMDSEEQEREQAYCKHLTTVYQPREFDTNTQESISCEDCGKEMNINIEDFGNMSFDLYTNELGEA